MIYVFLADGFEEMEALTPVDMLRRVGLEVKTVGATGKTVTGAHGIPVVADLTAWEIEISPVDGVVLPGGMPGTLNLEKSQVVQDMIDVCYQNGKLVAAICAAPSVLGHKGLLQGKKATCFPGFEQDCVGALMQPDVVVTDGNIITAKGAGCAMAFGAALIAYFLDHQTAEKLLQDMQV